MEWLSNNKEWLFSGIAVAIPLAIIGWALSTRINKQNQKGGDNSINIQIGKSLNIDRNKDDR